MGLGPESLVRRYGLSRARTLASYAVEDGGVPQDLLTEPNHIYSGYLQAPTKTVVDKAPFLLPIARGLADRDGSLCRARGFGTFCFLSSSRVSSRQERTLMAFGICPE